METLLDILLTLLTAALISRGIIPFLMNHSRKLGLIDRPGNRKVHRKATPVIGGLAIMLSLGLTAFILPMGQLFDEHSQWSVAVLLIFFMALMDDRFQLSAKIRLLIQLTAAVLVSTSGIRIESMFGLFGIYELPLLLQHMLTVLVIVGVTNAFNLIDGIDGLAGSFALVNFTVLGFLALHLQQEGIMIFCFAIAGAMLSFLKFNFHPARIFMGDAGSMSIGFILASLSILLLQSGEDVYSFSPFIVVSGILILPVTDAIRVFIGRYVKRLSLFNADKTHLHHLLLEQGYNHAQASIYLLTFHLLIILGGILLSYQASPTTCISLMISLQVILSKIFALNKILRDWGKIINQQEIR